jgi:hypothetical protein
VDGGVQVPFMYVFAMAAVCVMAPTHTVFSLLLVPAVTTAVPMGVPAPVVVVQPVWFAPSTTPKKYPLNVCKLTIILSILATR